MTHLYSQPSQRVLSSPEDHPDNNSERSESERRGTKRKISTTCCDVCEKEEAKYRCPNCLKCSCSLSCVKQHKLRSGCSGVRDRTAFVPLSQFGEIDLLSDYRFLEEVGRTADGPNRDGLLRTRSRHGFSVMLLKRKARAAKVNLKILPKSFSRRRENSSIYKESEKKLHWHLKLVFPQSDTEYTERVPEDRVLERILDDYVHPTGSDPVKRQRLKTYVQTPPDQISVFMKSEQREPDSPKYHKLDVKKTLHENLMLKTVLEYPELYVVLNKHRQEYLTRIPVKSSATPRPAPSSGAPDVPEAQKQPEVMKTTTKRTAESEPEDGEVLSEEEDGEADGTNATCDSLPHKDSKDDEEEEEGDDQDQTIDKKNDEGGQGGGGDDDDNGGDDDGAVETDRV
ncbi:box C/D snoRNA protein 1 isoform X2 [Trichomycterus rosablanca]|uniref:box C/D snoRNA protein 1 isoform X2 n=1 Tax=Trichomycterus rosablanca TaxID=2290929 RepID=UPI002F35384A